MARWLLLIPALAYIGVVEFWGPRVPVTGDEPHYLIIADSIIRDGDLRVVNNYREEAQRRAFIGPTDLHSKTFEYSVHYPAFAFLVSPAFAWWGPTGAKRMLALFLGLGFATLYFIIARRRLGELAAVGVAVAFSLSMPFVNGAGQLFPDLTSGLLVLALATAWRAELAGAQGRWSGWLFNLGVAVLPWLHLKQAAPMLVFAVVWSVSVLRRVQGDARVRALLPLLVPIASAAALLAYNVHAFGDWQGPYEPGSQTTELRKVAMIFLSLFFDQTQGMFLQQPLWLLGVVGLPILFRESRTFAVALCVLALSLLLPNAMHTNWFGGLTFVGRFFWSSAALWAFPTVAFLAWVDARTKGVVLMIALMSLLNQAWYATHWLDAPQRLYAWGFTTVERRGVLVEALRLRLPSFSDFDTYTSSWSLWLPLVLAAGLLTLGAFLSSRRVGADAR